MIIRKVKLTNFKNFKGKEVLFDPMTFIRGRNGSGKTTLALESILFCFWGYTPLSTLKDVPTRNVAKSTTVEIEASKKGKNYKVVRSYPTKLQIYENNELLQFANNSEAQSFINRLFGDRIQFMKFRIIDAYTKEANFLEEGETTLKKIIFSISEDFFNNMRKKLIQLKHNREIFNKDKAVIYTHYPSKKRIQLICSKIGELDKQMIELLQDIRGFEIDCGTIERDIGKYEGEKGYVKSKRDKALKSPKTCYACKQSISDSNQKRLLTEIGQQIQDLNKKIGKQAPELNNIKEILSSHKQVRERLSKRIYGLKELKMKLEARMKQIEYKWTDKDVLIAKKAIAELDRLSSYYMTESLKVLEPIINNVLAKIGFEVKFEVNDKGKFNIKLQKEGITYNQKDLSTGQKLILQIAFKLAILLNNNESGIIIADEGMSSLDEDNLNYIIKLFEHFPFQLVFVLHRMRTKICPKCNNKFDENLTTCPICKVTLTSLLENIKIIDLDKEE